MTAWSILAVGLIGDLLGVTPTGGVAGVQNDQSQMQLDGGNNTDSVTGGMANAVERAVVHGCESLQIFSKNANRWIGPPLDKADVRRFRSRLDETGIGA